MNEKIKLLAKRRADLEAAKVIKFEYLEKIQQVADYIAIMSPDGDQKR